MPDMRQCPETRPAGEGGRLSPVALISDRSYCVEVWVGFAFPEKGENRQGGKWVTHPTAPEFKTLEEAEKWAEQVCGNTRVLPVDRQTNQLQRRFFTPTVKLFEVAR